MSKSYQVNRLKERKKEISNCSLKDIIKKLKKNSTHRNPTSKKSQRARLSNKVAIDSV
jgi:hypothetical protein